MGSKRNPATWSPHAEYKEVSKLASEMASQMKGTSQKYTIVGTKHKMLWTEMAREDIAAL